MEQFSISALSAQTLHNSKSFSIAHSQVLIVNQFVIHNHFHHYTLAQYRYRCSASFGVTFFIQDIFT